MFCRSCGVENPDNAIYCKGCGEKLTSLTEGFSYQSSTHTKNVEGNYNKWVRTLSFIFGAFVLLGGFLGSGWSYYFESGIQLVLICEILLIAMSIFLILLGASPDYMTDKLSPWIDIERNYGAIVGVTIY